MSEPVAASAAISDAVEEPCEAEAAEADWVDVSEDDRWDARRRWAKIKGLEEHFLHKGWWSGALLATIIWMVGFESLLVAFVGWGWWDFTQYEWLVPTLMIQFLAQIVGLGILVVKSLFKDMD